MLDMYEDLSTLPASLNLQKLLKNDLEILKKKKHMKANDVQEISFY
jgi:hypothetical protein